MVHRTCSSSRRGGDFTLFALQSLSFPHPAFQSVHPIVLLTRLILFKLQRGISPSYNSVRPVTSGDHWANWKHGVAPSTDIKQTSYTPRGSVARSPANRLRTRVPAAELRLQNIGRFEEKKERKTFQDRLLALTAGKSSSCTYRSIHANKSFYHILPFPTLKDKIIGKGLLALAPTPELLFPGEGL